MQSSLLVGLNVTGVSTATNVSVASSVTAGTLFGNGAGLTNAGGGILLKRQLILLLDKQLLMLLFQLMILFHK